MNCFHLIWPHVAKALEATYVSIEIAVVVRGVRRNRRHGQETEGTCGSGPAQRPPSASLSVGGRVPSDAAAGGQKESAAGKNSAATGTGALPFFRWQVY
jgi:hypothetical protein